MGAFPVTVRPGPPQQLSGSAITEGSIVRNNDSANAVWVDNKQSISPGNGFRIGPLGYIQWTNKGSTATPWGCVDTGVVSPVALTISENVNQQDDPVSVGIAVAEQVNAIGVPATLFGAEIYNALGAPGTLDVSKYSMLSISASIAGAPGAFRMIFQDLAGNNIAFKDISMPDGASSVQFLINVPGPNLVIQLANGGGWFFRIFGSNRAIEGFQIQNPFYGDRLSVTSVWTSGTVEQLTSQFSGAGYFVFSGTMVKCRINKPTTLAGFLQYAYYDFPTNSLKMINMPPLMAAGTSEFEVDFWAPTGLGSIYFNPTASIASSTVFCEMVQGGILL